MSNCPQDTLNRIWRLYAAQGIGDDLQIIEALAYHLLHRSEDPDQFENSAYPQPISLNQERTQLLETSLTDALSNLSAADLLNHCLLFQPDSMQAGGRYPTPRHISRLMADLAQVFVTNKEASIADFACGSGGLLVEFAQHNVTGSEISPTWARLARANLRLHGMKDGDIYTGDTLVIVGSRVKNRFDIITMNPPFGSPMEAVLVDRHLHAGKGTRSETVLTLLALNYLSAAGVLVVLQPSGVLFSTSSGEATLRNRLLRENRLEAVIQLPKDAFQPYSQLQTYLLLARKATQSSQEADAPVWFYEIKHDGFSSGRNRQPQPDLSQLPNLVAAVQAQNAPAWEVKDDNGVTQLAVQTLSQGGALITQPGAGKLIVQALTQPNATAFWLTRQTETACHAFVHEGVTWDQQPLPSVVGGKLKPLSFPMADDNNRSVTLATEKRKWRLGLKEAKPVTVSETWQPESGFLALFAAEDGTPLSPLLHLAELHKDDKPKSLALWPLANRAGEAAGMLLLWDVTAVTPLYFAPENGVDAGWLLLPGEEEAALLGWRAGKISRVHAGRMQRAFAGETWHRGVAVDENGTRFGVGVSPAYIAEERDYDLTFDRYYLPDGGVETAVAQSAAELLATMRYKQQALAGRLDYLLGMIEMRPARALPPPLVDAAPFAPLNRSQHLVWQRIAAMRDSVNGVETGRPFRTGDVATGLNRAEVEQALALFERMGVVVPVMIDGAPYYRLVTERDMVTA